MRDFVATVSGCTAEWRSVMQVLADYASEYVITHTFAERKPEQTPVIPRQALHMPGSPKMSAIMRNYLSKRGFSPEYMIDKYLLQDGGIAGEWAFRLMIPVYMDGRLIAWQGRHVGADKVRYRASSIEESLLNIKDIVYNLDNCVGYDTVIAVEGVMDCWKIGDGCVALFGISVKDSQLRLLADRFSKVCFMFDPEPLAQQRARECARKLELMGTESTVICMEDTSSEDPGDMLPSEVRDVRKMIFNDESGTPWLLPIKGDGNG